tara:strand:+ start:630 stop:1451 length:822 start_codon:yes stop_codon:yes gene_type:complete
MDKRKIIWSDGFSFRNKRRKRAVKWRVFAHLLVVNGNVRIFREIRAFKTLLLRERRATVQKEKCRCTKVKRKWINMRKNILKKYYQKQRLEAKMLRAPSAGIKVKGRDGSTRHGFIVSFSAHHRPVLTVQEIEHRNSILRVDKNICFWCKVSPQEDMDHAHPACSTTTSTYSWTNNLNIFPACKPCNSKKGGKPLSVWLTKIEANGLWTSTQIQIFKHWLDSNKSKLIFNQQDTLYVEEQFVSINTFHKLAEYCTKFRKEIAQFVTFQLPEDF